MECPGQVARWKTELGESWASPETPGTQPVPDTISTHRRGRDPLLTAVVLSPQVVGFRDVLHQAHPPAWHHHCHRQLLHLPDQQEEGRCCARHLWAWQAVGAGVSLLLWGPGGRCLPPSSLSPFALPPAFIWTKGFKTAAGPGGREGCPDVCVCPCPGPASIQAEWGLGGCSDCSRREKESFWSGVLAKQRKTVGSPAFFVVVDLVFHLNFTSCLLGLRESPDSALCLGAGQGTWHFQVLALMPSSKRTWAFAKPGLPPGPLGTPE